MIDRFPNSPESICKSDGSLVFLGDRIAGIVTGSVIGMMGVQMAISLAAVDLSGYSLLCLLTLPLVALCLLVRHETTITPQAGTITKLWRLWGDSCYTFGSQNLSDFDAVTFGWYLVSTKNGSYRVYCVGLRKVSNGEMMRLARVKDETESRTIGELVAKSLQLPLQRLGSEESRSVDELDKKLAERVDEGELPTAPEGMRSQLRHEDECFVIDIAPPSPDTASMKIAKYVAVACGVIGGVFIVVQSVAGGLGLLGTFILLAGGALCGRWLYRFIIEGTNKQLQKQAARVTLSADRLLIWERDMHDRESTAEILYDDLEEFYHNTKKVPTDTEEWQVGFLTPSTTLVASSDQVSKEFAAWLPRPEKEYIVAAVRQMVVRMNQQPQPGGAGISESSSEELEAVTA